LICDISIANLTPIASLFILLRNLRLSYINNKANERCKNIRRYLGSAIYSNYFAARSTHLKVGNLWLA